MMEQVTHGSKFYIIVIATLNKRKRELCAEMATSSPMKNGQPNQVAKIKGKMLSTILMRQIPD